MKFSTIGLTTVALALLSGGTAVHAAEVPKLSDNTSTKVNIIDVPLSDAADLELIHVPAFYNFQTKLQADGTYSLNGSIVENDNKVIVFNDKSIQDWTVKASIDNSKLTTGTNSEKEAIITNFKINGQELLGEKTNQIIHKAETTKTIENNTGTISKEVTKDGLSVSFVNKNNDLKAGDSLNGTVHYQLTNTPETN